MNKGLEQQAISVEVMIEVTARAIAPKIMWEFDGWRLDKPVPWDGIGKNDQETLREIARIAALTLSDTLRKEVRAEAAQRLQDHMEQFHGISLKASEWDAAIRALGNEG